MTRSRRNITPGKGDIYTFMDCQYYEGCEECWKPVRVGYSNGELSDLPTWCKIYAGLKRCPEGYTR